MVAEPPNSCNACLPCVCQQWVRDLSIGETTRETMQRAGEVLRRDAEEWVNLVTHGLGMVASVVGSILLLAYAWMNGEATHVLAVGAFSVGLMAVYASSTAYHGALEENWKEFLRLIDHLCIFLLIAGTYTPISLILMKGAPGWWLFGLVWAFAVGGVAYKCYLFKHYGGGGTWIYVVMGLLALPFAGPLIETVPAEGAWLILVGGACYLVGVIFFLWEKMAYNHAVWHLFVMAGSLLHFLFVFWYVVPWPELA